MNQQKSKLGISVALLGAIQCILVLVGGYEVMLFILGYILILEKNMWLRRNSLKVVVFSLLISFIQAVFGLIPDAVAFISNFAYIFNGSFYAETLTRVVDVIIRAFALIKNVILILFAVKAFGMGTVKVKFLDNLMDKHIFREN